MNNTTNEILFAETTPSAISIKRTRLKTERFDLVQRNTIEVELINRHINYKDFRATKSTQILDTQEEAARFAQFFGHTLDMTTSVDHKQGKG